MSKLLVLTALTLLASNAVAQTTRKDAQDMAKTYADCAGIWDWHSELNKSDGRNAVAEQLRNTGNGAEFAAMWILASHHGIEMKEVTRYGTWKEMTRPIRESGALRMKGLAELDDQEGIKAAFDLCVALVDGQERVLTEARRDRALESVRDGANQPQPN